MAELASGLATKRLNSATDRLTATRAPGAPASTAGSDVGATADPRRDIQVRSKDFVAVSNGAATLTGNRVVAATAQETAAARRELVEFVRTNGTAEQLKQAEALANGDTRSQGASANAATPATPATPAAGGTAATPATPATPARQAVDPDSSRTNYERQRLDADRDALAKLTQFTSNQRQNNPFGGASRGSVLNLFA